MRRFSLALLLAGAVVSQASAQKDLAERVRALENKVRVLEGELEQQELGAGLVPVLGQGKHGLAPAASKVYALEQGLSIGGYGEFLYEQRSGTTDRFDTLRSILYVGYRFDEQWVFNSELEFEHGTTSSSSGTTSSGGSVSVEFAYLDFLHDEALNFRGGLLLSPMGLINEMHEPTTFFAADRPETERRIIPSTWRETGVGIFGEVAGFEYRAYAITALDGDRFSASGLRGGRQKGNRSAADDFALVVRGDYVDTPGLLVGASAYFGHSGQDGMQGTTAIPQMPLGIVELHAQYEAGPFKARALAALAFLDDAGDFNRATGGNVARRLEGYYAEIGYDVMSLFEGESEVVVSPFVRFEHIDTQADMPSGFSPIRSQEDDIFTVGLFVQPIPQVVFKASFEAKDQGRDEFNALIGYVF